MQGRHGKNVGCYKTARRRASFAQERKYQYVFLLNADVIIDLYYRSVLYLFKGLVLIARKVAILPAVVQFTLVYIHHFIIYLIFFTYIPHEHRLLKTCLLSVQQKILYNVICLVLGVPAEQRDRWNRQDTVINYMKYRTNSASANGFMGRCILPIIPFSLSSHASMLHIS